jgi:hypothetical protein
VRRRVLVLSSGIFSSPRYSEIVLHQSVVKLGSPTIAATSPSGPGLGLISPVEGPESAFDVGTGPSSPSGAPGMGIGPSASRKVPDIGSGISSLSQMESLSKSCANTPGRGDS